MVAMVIAGRRAYRIVELGMENASSTKQRERGIQASYRLTVNTCAEQQKADKRDSGHGGDQTFYHRWIPRSRRDPHPSPSLIQVTRE